MKIVLAYSGGLDTSVALHWLRERYQADVLAYCADLGQPGSLEDVRRRAVQGGAADVVVDDQRDTYVRDYVFPALRANAAYERRYLMAAPLGRPLIGKRLVEVARAEGADAVAHGSTGKGNDGVRFYAAVVAHDPSLRVLAPAAEWELASRADELRYAERHGIEVPVGVESPYSMDGSIWGTSTECGPVEDPGAPPPDDAWQLTSSVDEAPDAPAEVTVGFDRGFPVALDGAECPPVDLVRTLTELGGAHGVGRVDMVESSLLGIKTRALYECPAGTILHAAHRELESLCLDRDTLRFKAAVDQRYAELVYDGLWFSPLRRSLDRFVDATQQPVSGTVAVRLHKGTATCRQRESPSSLYDPSVSSHDAGDRFDHTAAAGFSYVWSMPLRVGRLVRSGRAARGSPASRRSSTPPPG
jgi:argininosuccinate synthase